MTWKPWHYALMGGVSASLGVLGYALLKKKRDYDEMAGRIRTEMVSSLGRGVYRDQLNALRTLLALRAETLANQTADAHIAEAYGLTPSRLEGLQRLARILGG